MWYAVAMVQENSVNELDSVADILSRAFDSVATLPSATAELILKARLPETDIQRVDNLLQQKREAGLSNDQEILLQDYLHADSILTLLKSKARGSLGQAAVA